MNPTPQVAPPCPANAAARPVRLYIPFAVFALISLAWLPGLGATIRTWLATAGFGSVPAMYDAESVSVDTTLVIPAWVALGVAALIVALIVTRAKHVTAAIVAFLVSTIGLLTAFLALSYSMF